MDPADIDVRIYYRTIYIHARINYHVFNITFSEKMLFQTAVRTLYVRSAAVDPSNRAFIQCANQKHRLVLAAALQGAGAGISVSPGGTGAVKTSLARMPQLLVLCPPTQQISLSQNTHSFFLKAKRLHLDFLCKALRRSTVLSMTSA